ncbi:MAG: hypothetical protein OHK0039_14850 [Bacteroidia bacterium]
MKRLWFIPALLWVALLAGCGQDDLSFINEVKRFDPEWMSLSNKVSFLDRYLRLTERRYAQDLQEINPYLSDPATTERTNLQGMRSQYRNMMEERDQLAAAFVEEKKTFVETVERFNTWQTRLMKNRLDMDEAPADLQAFQQDYRELSESITAMQNKLILNIEQHNALMRRITGAAGLYTNYEIRYDR